MLYFYIYCLPIYILYFYSLPAYLCILPTNIVIVSGQATFPMANCVCGLPLQFAWTHVTLLIVVTQSHLVIQNLFEGMIW